MEFLDHDIIIYFQFKIKTKKNNNKKLQTILKTLYMEQVGFAPLDQLFQFPYCFPSTFWVWDWFSFRKCWSKTCYIWHMWLKSMLQIQIGQILS